jgi:hypothetical protein
VTTLENRPRTTDFDSTEHQAEPAELSRDLAVGVTPLGRTREETA